MKGKEAGDQGRMKAGNKKGARGGRDRATKQSKSMGKTQGVWRRRREGREGGRGRGRSVREIQHDTASAPPRTLVREEIR